MKNYFQLLVACFALISCTPKKDSGEKVFNTYTKERIQGLDPALAMDIFSQQALMQVYEGLYHFHYLKRPLQIEPLLAEGMPGVSPDGLTYTFKIKKNIFFQKSEAFKNSQRELTAQDFIYSWKRLADPKIASPNYWVLRGKVQGLEAWREEMTQGKSTYDTQVAGLQAVDDYTLVVKLNKPDYQFLNLLSSSMTAVVAREVVEKYGAEFSAHPVGTGAFMFESWQRGSKLIYVKNPTYRDVRYPSEASDELKAQGLLQDQGLRLPLLDRIVIHEIVEEQPQWLSFQKGQLDTLFVPKDYLQLVIKDGKLAQEFETHGMKLQLAPSTDVVYISMNTENSFLKNKKVRQAISSAYDKKSFIKTFFSDLGVPAHGPIPPNLLGYRKNFENINIKYDLGRAEELLKQAGFPHGKGLPEMTFEIGSGHSTARQVAEFFKNQMEKIGIKVKININTWAKFSEKVKNKQAMIFDMSWNADYPDADNFLQLFYSKNVSPGPNNSNFKNALYDELYEKSLITPPGAEKTKLYEQMEDLLMEESPWIFNLHRVRALLYQGWLKNFRHDYIVLDSMKYYRVDANLRDQLKKDL